MTTTPVYWPLFLVNLGKLAPERQNHLDFNESRGDGVAVASAGPQANTSLQTDNHDSTSSLKFLRAGCSSCHPTNSQSTEGNLLFISVCDDGLDPFEPLSGA